jgi:uncharacterized protein DUF3592
MAVVLLALLIVALIVAAVTIRKERAFEAAAVHGEGVITDLRFKRVGPLDDRDVLAYPLVRLTLPDGLTVENWAERPVAHGEVGEEVDVLYLPDDPKRIRINRG